MNIQVVLIFLVLTIAIHVVLQKINIIFLDNLKLKQKLDGSDTDTILRVESPDDRPGVKITKESCQKLLVNPNTQTYDFEIIE